MHTPASKSVSVWRRRLPDWTGFIPVAFLVVGQVAVVAIDGDQGDWIGPTAFAVAAVVIAVMITLLGRLHRRAGEPLTARQLTPAEWRAVERKRVRRLLSGLAIATALVAAYPASAGPAWFGVGRGWLSRATVEAAYRPIWKMTRGTAFRSPYREYCEWSLYAGASQGPPLRTSSR